MGRMHASDVDVGSVNLRVHRGGGAGGGARTSGECWTSPSNRASNSQRHTTSQFGITVDEDSDSGTGRPSGVHGASTSDGGCFLRPSGENADSRDTTAVSGADADAKDESPRHPGTSGCCMWSRRVSSSSQRRRKRTTETDSSLQRTCSSPTEPNVDSSTPRRRRVVSKLTSEGDVAVETVPDGGIESLVQSTLAPVFEQCSVNAEGRSSANMELVNASQAHARRRFVQIRTHLRRLNREKKAAKTVGVIVGCFVLCWAPFFTVYVLGVFCGNCTPPVVFIVFFWLGYCNSAINPFVYALCSKDFRFAFRRLLRCGRDSRHHGSNSTIAALVSGLRTTAPPRFGSESVIATVRFSAVNRQ